MVRHSVLAAVGLGLWALAGCSDDPQGAAGSGGAAGTGGAGDAGGAGDPAVVEGPCQISGAAPEFLRDVTCTADFKALASQPIDANLPGARSGKVVLDQSDASALYFQDTNRYQIHYQFVSSHLSGNGHPIVGPLSDFNGSEYYSPDRRFILGAVTYYAGPNVWALEIAPYDTMSAAMIQRLYETVQAHTFFGPALAFHPTSEAVAAEARKLPASVRIKTTDDLYAAIDFQPLTLGTTVGRLHLTKAAKLTTEYLAREDIVVLDQAPNDISVVRGLITEEFQTPLSHVNVLAQNRHSPNMGLRRALSNPELTSRDGKLVELTVTAGEGKIRDATEAEAAAYDAAHRPTPVALPPLDLTVEDLRNIEDVTPEVEGVTLRESIRRALPAFGGKAAHYSILARTPGVPVQKAFAVPVYYYDLFFRQNGLWAMIDRFLADPQFQSDPKVRDQKLAELRAAIMAGAVDMGLQTLLMQKLAAEYPGHKMRFRTSTNSEDLDGFPCAGCYESHTGDPADWNDLLDAIRETYASTWLFRTFEERAFYGVDHRGVAMALLVHHNFPDEEANGVAVTNNPFDATGLEPAFYVNVQFGGDAEVVAPPPGITSDQFLYFFDSPNQPITYLSHSNLVTPGTTVLTGRQIHDLGVVLDAIHKRFSPAYGPASGNMGWYALEVDLKFDDEAAPGQPPALYVKQARPHPGRGS